MDGFGLLQWYTSAMPGDSIVYGIGTSAREFGMGPGNVADAAIQMAHDGLVHLVQRRTGDRNLHGIGKFEYVAIKAQDIKPMFAEKPKRKYRHVVKRLDAKP